jgi:hypothetical protein
MGLRKQLKEKALSLSQKAFERLMSDEKRAMKIAEAIGSVQRGKQALDRTQEQVMHALNFAAKSDFKTLGKKLSALKRRVRELDERL